ncbi:MAG: hypothetical protein WBQ23_02655 [Bacteroidota bacterium]
MNLETLLTGLLHGRISSTETDTIIRTALGYARSYIRWLTWNRSYTIVPLGMSLDDMAVDTIAELMSEIDGEHMQRLRRALEDVASGGPEIIPLECAFKAVVLRTVRLNIARIFIEMHPVRARLLRSLRRFAQSSGKIIRHDGIAGYWYSFSAVDPCLELPAAPPDVLRGIFTVPRVHVRPAPSVLTALLEALAAFPELRQAVSEDDVLDITLRLLETDQDAATPQFQDAEEHSNSNPLEAEALEALSSLQPWIFSSYVSSGKLTEDEASAMLIAAERYIRDLASGEERGHFSYLRSLLPDLTHEHYRSHYRNVYEYILRTIFTNTRERLQLYNEGSENNTTRR